MANSLTWLLVSGAGRSGTRLLSELIHAHPEVALTYEAGLTRCVASIADLSQLIRLEKVRGAPLPAEPEAVAVPAAAPAPQSAEPTQAKFEFQTSVDTVPVHQPAPALRVMDKIRQAEDYYGRREQAETDIVARTATVDPALFDRIARDYFKSLYPNKKIRVVGDKFPNSDPAWADIPYLQSVVGDLRILLILRRPFDVINSSMHRKARTEIGVEDWPIKTVHEAIEQYVTAWHSSVELSMQDESPVHIIKYEDLIAAPEDVMRGVFDFLGVPARKPAYRPTPPAKDLRHSFLSEQDMQCARDRLGIIEDAWDLQQGRAILGHFPKIPPLMAVGQTMGLNVLETPLEQTLDGFSGSEPIGRWTDGPNASVALMIPREAAGGILQFQFSMTYVLEGNSHCYFYTTINGRNRTLHALGPGESAIGFWLNDEALANDRIVNVEFEVLKPKPRSLGPDHRSHGLCLFSIKLIGPL